MTHVPHTNPDSQKYDDVLLPFLALMRKELHANSGKGDRPGWLAMRPDEALLEVYYHLSKLQKAVKHNDGPAIMEYSADVANMAMMVLDICGGLAWVEASPIPQEDADALDGRLLDQLHAAIMNLTPRGPRGTIHSDGYLAGHRDTRNAAAKLVAAMRAGQEGEARDADSNGGTKR